MATGTPVVVSRIQNRRGLQQDFNNLYPTGSYLGIYPTNQPGIGPNVLQPGEIALCTDTGHVYIGTQQAGVSGYYITVGSSGSSGPASNSNLPLTPIIAALPPASTWTDILSAFSATPFFNIPYSVVDVTTANPNEVGTTLSKNGELAITSTSTAATLTDTSTEINSTPYNISFRATKVSSNIQLQYMHNFPVSLTFSTSSIIWASI